MTPQQTVTAVAMAALRNDADGLALLLIEMPPDEAITVAGVALINLCSGFRQIITPEAWEEITAGMQALAVDLNQEEASP